jgi:hypothetical protein
VIHCNIFDELKLKSIHFNTDDQWIIDHYNFHYNQMSQYIKEFGKQGQIVKDIIQHVVLDKSEMRASKIYNSIDDERLVDVTKRSSVYKTIIDNQLFDLFDQLLVRINELDKSCNFFLVRNDITYIKYSEGDFFDQHEDYLSITSNFIEEYTMIICADADCVGGKTIFEINPFMTYCCESSIRPEHCFVFRKDLKHSGEKIIKGYKNIITANLLCVSKKTDQLILIRFPDSDPKTETGPDSKLKTDLNLEHQTNHDSLETDETVYNESKNEITFMMEQNNKYFVLSVNLLNEFQNNYFTAFVKFNRLNDQQIIQYDEKNVDYDSFSVIYKIFNKCYITLGEYNKVKQIIDYYMIPMGDLLIDVNPLDLTSIQPTASDPRIQWITDQILIINDVNEFQYACNELANSGDYKYMLPFKLMFVEGSIWEINEESTGDHRCYNEKEKDFISLSMRPVWFSVSENDNVIYLENLVRNYDIDRIVKDWKLERKNRYYVNFCEKTKNLQQKIKTNKKIYFVQECDEIDKTDEKVNIIYNEDMLYDSSKLFFNGDLHILKTNTLKMIDLIFRNSLGYTLVGQTFKSSHSVKLAKMHDEEDGLICLDKDKRIVLNPKMMDQLNQILDEMNIIDKVSSNMNNIKFKLPQVKKNNDIYFCNETMYGSCNFLIVHGFIKLPHP